MFMYNNHHNYPLNMLQFCQLYLSKAGKAQWPCGLLAKGGQGSGFIFLCSVFNTVLYHVLPLPFNVTSKSWLPGDIEHPFIVSIRWLRGRIQA